MGDNIISTMIKQHRGLQKDLAGVAKDLEEGSPDVKEIHAFLDKFNKDLTEHLKLENEVFYAELLEKMKEAGQDTTKTESFIAQMKDIGESVGGFLKKYDDPKNIEEKLVEFKKEFKEMLEILVLRIESEESGVYSYWGLF